MAPEKESEYMTLADVAKQVCVTPGTIWRAVRDGMLKGQRVGNRRWIVARADYRDWLARGAPTRPAKEAEA